MRLLLSESSRQLVPIPGISRRLVPTHGCIARTRPSLLGLLSCDSLRRVDKPLAGFRIATNRHCRSTPTDFGQVILRRLATRLARRTRARDDAALSIEVQLHAGDLGQADREPRGPPKGRPVVYRVD